ncbi:MAG: hypothetical protein ABSB28_01865 [Candidatus Bathyarchaeia archaeon]
MNKKILLIALLLVLASPMVAFAAQDQIRVIPVGSSDTGMARITTSSASLEIFVTSSNKNKTNVWLFIALDDATYNGLTSITLSGTQGPATLTKSSFTSIALSGGGKVPLTNDGNYTGDGHTYPGCADNARWTVSAIISQMQQVYSAANSIHYGLVYGFDKITTVPQAFTVTVNAPHINVLVLAQGLSEGATTASTITTLTVIPLDSNSPFSGSTLVVPEVGTILAAIASLGAFGLYISKRRKK